MPKLSRFPFLICLLAPYVLTAAGCAQMGYAKRGKVQSEVCRSCHVPNGTAGAKDFGEIYAHPRSHHPVGVVYPDGSIADQKFNPPNRYTADIAFFDRNGNHRADSNEVQLFGAKGEATVECASCHAEHGNGHPALPGTHLRVDNRGSGLCLTCHRQ